MNRLDLWKRIWDFLKATITYATIEKIIRYAIYLFNTAIKMKCIDIDGEIEITDLSIKSIVEDSHFCSVDKDISTGKMFQYFETPKVGRYKLISFHNGSGGISLIDIRLITRLMSWKFATLSEVVSVGEFCSFRDLGIDQGSTIVGLGTIIEKESAISSWFSLQYSPVVSFSVKEVDGKPIKEKTVRLHNLSDNYPSDKYILIRVN